MPNRTFRSVVLLTLLAIASKSFAKQPVLVISIDGLDQRYLGDRDKLGLKIPTLRRLIAEGQWSAGVVGVVPTVTWPSHTTMITGLDPTEHGILNNRRPANEGGNYYWTVDLLKTTTLLDGAHAAGLKTATITWPVTVGAASDFNLPEYFGKRQGASMDLRTMSTQANPRDLAERITKMFPSFHQEWVDDRTRILALRYLLRTERPDFILVHLVDLDNEAHQNGPFTPEALSVLEYQDELIGTALRNCRRIMRWCWYPTMGSKRSSVRSTLVSSPVNGTFRDCACWAEWSRRRTRNPMSSFESCKAIRSTALDVRSRKQRFSDSNLV